MHLNAIVSEVQKPLVPLKRNVVQRSPSHGQMLSLKLLPMCFDGSVILLETLDNPKLTTKNLLNDWLHVFRCVSNGETVGLLKRSSLRKKSASSGGASRWPCTAVQVTSDGCRETNTKKQQEPTHMRDARKR